MLFINQKKEYISVFDSPECKNEDTNCSNIGQPIVITDSLSIEIAAVFDGNGGKEASRFLKENFISCFMSSIQITSLVDLNPNDESMNGDMHKDIINTGVLAVDNALCDHLKIQDLRGRDPGSTLSAWVNFITPIGNTSYLVNVGDSPAYSVCKQTGVITCAKLHDIIDLECQSDATKHPDVSVIDRRGSQPILAVCIISPDICKMVQSGTMLYKNGLRGLNIPRSMGHIHWNDAINKTPEITNVPDEADVIVLMSDGVSDMIVSPSEYMKHSEEMGWDVDKIGSFYRDRWYQPWKQLYRGVVSDERQYIAIKGHKLHVADDMTIVQINIENK